MFPKSIRLCGRNAYAAALSILLVLLLLPIDNHAHAASNVALGRPVTVTTNGVDDPNPGWGRSPSDITDGRLDYTPVSSRPEDDGVVGYVNNDYNQPMHVFVTIDLGRIYNITSIRYNMRDIDIQYRVL
jgi:hypothetical protein